MQPITMIIEKTCRSVTRALVMIFQSLVMILPVFSTLKDDNEVSRQKLKTLRQNSVAMKMMNKCAKFHKDIPSGKKVKFNLARAIELSETAVLCTTLYRNLMQASNFGGTFDQLFLWIFYETFTEDASQLLLYHGAKKVKNDQNPNSRGAGPPWFEFLVIFDFFAPWHRRGREASSVKIS